MSLISSKNIFAARACLKVLQAHLIMILFLAATLGVSQASANTLRGAYSFSADEITLDIKTIKAELSYLRRSPELVIKIEEIKNSLNPDAPKMLSIDLDLFKLDVLSKLGEYEAAAALADDIYSSIPREYYPSEKQYGDTLYQVVESLAKTDNLGIAYKIILKLRASIYQNPDTYLNFILDKSLVEVSIEISDYNHALNLLLQMLNNPEYMPVNDIQKWRPSAINEIAYLYNQLGDGDTALIYLEKAAKIIEKQDLTTAKLNKARALNLANRGRAYLLNADYEQAEKMGIAVGVANKTLQQNYLSAVSHRLIGNSAYNQGDYNKALWELEAGLKLAKNDNSLSLRRNLYKDYALTLESMNRAEASIIWYKKLFGLENNRQETIVATRAILSDLEFSAFKSHQELMHLQHKFERNKSISKMMLVTILSLLSGAGFLAYFLFYMRKSQKNLIKSEMKAQSANQAKSTFLANMSHEIRTPMNGVLGMAQLLERTALAPQQKQYVDIIKGSGTTLLVLINDILDFSKIDAGQMELDPAPFDLSEAIEDVATLVSSKVAEKDLELIVRVDPTLPSIMIGDVGRIRQIVTNLLGNAVKFTEKGHIFINIEGNTISQDGCDVAEIRFSIEDTGIGIPEEKSKQVFNKFSQVDTSATRKHEGTGLGLSISSSLVELMGGEIGVESKVGTGSTFWFTASLPVHKQGKQKQIVPGDMSGAKVLVIDDNKVNRSILTEQMSAWKFDGASATSGEEGLKVMRAVAANNIKLDLVILDYQMPEMSGAQVLEIMRNDEVLKDIPVVMLTSIDSSQTNQHLTKLGAEANLTKPARSSMLLETMLQVIANNRANLKTTISNLSAKPVVDKSLPKDILEQTRTPNSDNLQLDILVAEDNEVNQIVFSQILEETGLNFKIVENGRLAVAEYIGKKPKLILMDVSMPEMNGKEATIAIRQHERANKMKRVPIVGVTAHALKGDMESCIDAGMDDYLSKPVSPNKLTLKVEQWLKVKFEKPATG